MWLHGNVQVPVCLLREAAYIRADVNVSVFQVWTNLGGAGRNFKDFVALSFILPIPPVQLLHILVTGAVTLITPALPSGPSCPCAHLYALKSVLYGEESV